MRNPKLREKKLIAFLIVSFRFEALAPLTSSYRVTNIVDRRTWRSGRRERHGIFAIAGAGPAVFR